MFNCVAVIFFIHCYNCSVVEIHCDWLNKNSFNNSVVRFLFSRIKKKLKGMHSGKRVLEQEKFYP